MTCAESTFLIHLDRPGERNEREEHALRRHLETCAVCRAELDLTLRTAVAYERATRSPQPGPEDISGILSAVRTTDTPGGAEVILSLASRRSVRIAYGLSLAASIVAMIGQIALPQRIQDARAERPDRVFVSMRLDAHESAVARAEILPRELRSRLMLDVANREIRKDRLREILATTGQVTLRTLRLTPEQRRLAEELLIALEATASLRVRFNPTGG